MHPGAPIQLTWHCAGRRGPSHFSARCWGKPVPRHAWVCVRAAELPARPAEVDCRAVLFFHWDPGWGIPPTQRIWGNSYMLMHFQL